MQPNDLSIVLIFKVGIEKLFEEIEKVFLIPIFYFLKEHKATFNTDFTQLIFRSQGQGQFCNMNFILSATRSIYKSTNFNSIYNKLVSLFITIYINNFLLHLLSLALVSSSLSTSSQHSSSIWPPLLLSSANSLCHYFY